MPVALQAGPLIVEIETEGARLAAAAFERRPLGDDEPEARNTLDALVR